MAEVLDLTGKIIGGFRLERLLGSGAMGPVYASTHRDTGQRAALKIIPSGHLPARALVERFSNDLKLLRTIVHPGLLNIYDAGKIASVGVYLAAELLEGKPLPAMIAAAPNGMSISQALALAEGICSALAAVHDVGVLHRNVRPSNVFVVKAGKRLQVKLLDFGVPGLAPVPGAHDYRAPEQLPQAPINEGADIYCTGLILYELLTGQKISHQDDPPPRPSRFRPEVSPALDSLVLEVLARFPESRPASAAQLRDQLSQLRADLPSVTGETHLSGPRAMGPSDDPKTEIPSVMLKGVPPQVLDETPTEIPPELLMTPPPLPKQLSETTPGRPNAIAEAPTQLPRASPRPPMASPRPPLERSSPARAEAAPPPRASGSKPQVRSSGSKPAVRPPPPEPEAIAPEPPKKAAPKPPPPAPAERSRAPEPEPAPPPDTSERPKKIAAWVLGLAAAVASVWFWRQPIKHYSAEDDPVPAQADGQPQPQQPQQPKKKAPAFDPSAPMTDDDLVTPPAKPDRPGRPDKGKHH